MTIATFNQRAQRVVGALGFQQAGCFHGSADNQDYVVLVRHEGRRGNDMIAATMPLGRVSQ